MFDLHPVVRPATDRVATIEPFGHDPLQPELAAGLECSREVAIETWRQLRGPGRGHRGLQSVPARAVDQCGERVAVHLEQVEEHELHRCPFRRCCDLPGLGELHPCLEQTKVGAPAFVDGHDLAVEHRGIRF